MAGRNPISSHRFRNLTFIKLVVSFVGVGAYAVTACGPSTASESSIAAISDSGTVTWYDPGEMPVECNAPKGIPSHMGVAVTEGSPLMNYQSCPKKNDQGLPDCTDILAKNRICGTIVEVKNEQTGKTAKGYISGFCPADHPNNSPKGQWNPCGRGRTNFDMQRGIYEAAGFNPAQSWGQNGNTGTVNPQAGRATVTIVGHDPYASTRVKPSCDPNCAPAGGPWFQNRNLKGAETPNKPSQPQQAAAGSQMWQDSYSKAQFPYCSSSQYATSKDWGWENGKSCKVR